MTATRCARALAMAGALWALALAVQAQAPANVAQGRQVAERLCAGCHAIDGGGSGGTYQKADVPSFRAIANRPDRTADRLRGYIMTPHPPMPAVPLTLAEINDIAAYILSLK